jgi:serine/threonine-protein kinase
MFDLVEHRITNGDGQVTVIPCLTMRLLEGESLADFLRSRRPLPPDQALPIIRQVAESLHAMHEKQFVHRDLKPSNIMLITEEGENAGLRVVLIDFGLAKPFNGNEEMWQTRTAQQQPGAPYFLAPEVFSGDTGSIAADLYAFGLLIDEMVTRSPAFPHTSIEELYWRKIQGQPELPSSRADGLPGHWEQVILRCLSLDIERRPKSALEVVAHLEDPALLAPPEPEAAPEPVPEPEPALEPPRAPRFLLSRRQAIAAGSGITLAVMAALFAKFDTDSVESSILIFPFENRTRQPEYDHLCSGTVEELIRRLSYVDRLSIYPIPRNWTPDAAALKKAAFSLKGTLQYLRGQVRLSVQLVENSRGMLIWEDTYDSLLNRPLELEAEITAQTVEGIRDRISENYRLPSTVHGFRRVVRSTIRRASGHQSALPKQSTASNQAFTEYQRGRDYWQQRTLPAALEAVGCFNRAITYDPKFALAYAAQADVQQTLLNYNYAPTLQLLTAALKNAEKAVTLDNSLPECHVSLAAARQNLWDWELADTSYKLAIDRHSRFPRAHHWYAGLLLQFARFEEALQRVRTGLALDPFDYPAQSNYGLYLWNAGRTRDAAKQLEYVLTKVDLIYAHNVLGQVYAELSGSTAEPEATDYFVRSMREAGTVRNRDLEAVGGVDPGYLKWSDLISAQAFAARNDRSSALHYVNRLERGLEAGKISASAVAWAHAVVGNRKRVIELLQLGFEQREREMLYVRVIPLFRKMHKELQFQQLLRRMRLT